MAMQQQIVYGAYSLVLTVPFFVFILIKSRTDVPPSYHWVRQNMTQIFELEKPDFPF